MKTITPKLSKRAIAILRKVQKAIVAEPYLYNQSEPYQPDHQCNTPGCICGWIDYFLGVSNSNLLYEGPGVRLVGGCEAYDRLYDRSAWPKAYSLGFSHLKEAGRARRASRRIDHFIETGGAE